MKKIIALCALLACLPADAQTVYRWVDGNGRVQYTVLVGTQRMNGYSEDRLAQMLKGAGY